MYNQTYRAIIALFRAMFAIVGCGGGGEQSTTPLGGVAQKGPFQIDSNVSLCKLEDNMTCSDTKVEARVTDKNGSYTFPSIAWSGLSKLTISGYYLDKTTGISSTEPATITALIDIKQV